MLVAGVPRLMAGGRKLKAMYKPQLRCLLAAGVAVALLHLPPVGDAAAAARGALRAWVSMRVVQRVLPSAAQLVVTERPAVGEEAGLVDLHWPDGAVVDVSERFDTLVRSFDVVRSTCATPLC